MIAAPLGTLRRCSTPLALGAILVLAALLRLWRLDEGGVLVPYYFAGVRSMLESWHNLFFNAFDPAGFVSLDKPPVAFWLQTLSAGLFGFGRASVLLPQAVEGLAAILVLYALVRRQFGAAAGLLAALFLALTPIEVAVDRSNNTESCLVLVLLLAAWTFARAIETGRLRWLLATAALIGIGFNVKMLVAFGIVPVFALVYVVWAPGGFGRRIGRLAAAASVLAAVSLSWSLAYDLTPPDSRPYVDSSPSNSMLELVIGHNFVQRFVRPAGFGRGERARAAAAAATDGTAAQQQPPGRDYAPAGPLRLAAPALAAQIGWLLPLALIGGIAAWRRSEPSARPRVAVWAGWAVVYGIVFSAAGGLFHAYYLAGLMAPPLCALSAIGLSRLWLLGRISRPTAAILPAAVVLTGLWQAYILYFYPTGSLAVGEGWIPLALLGLAAAAGGAMLALRSRPLGLAAGGAAALAVLLAMPAAWSVGTSLATVEAGFPAARPPFLTADAETRRGRFAEIAGAIAGDPKLIEFLEDSRGDEAYLLAAVNARLAAPIIIATGAPVMALGGFSGRDPILTVADFARLVAENRIRFALIGDGSEGLRRVYGEGGQRPLTDWIRENGRPIDPARWRSALAGPPDRAAENVGAELYDLRPAGN